MRRFVDAPLGWDEDGDVARPTVGHLIAELQKFPDDAECWVYAGEVVGVVVRGLGYVPTEPRSTNPAMLAVFDEGAPPERGEVPED